MMPRTDPFVLAREAVAEAAEAAQAVDRDARWPVEGLGALRRVGLGGLVVPATVGGLGLGLLALAKVCEIVGRACASTAICYGMHCVGAAVIAAKATAHHRLRYLEPIAGGTHLTTLALSEPTSGSHFYLPETRLTPSGGDFLVSGRKAFVTNGGQADSYVVSVVADGPDVPDGQFSCVLVDANADSLVWGAPWNGFGMRGNSSRQLTLSDVHVPRHNLLGAEGDQIWYVFEVVAPFFLLAMAGTYLGIATVALDEARDHLKARHYSMTGRSLSSVAVLQHRLGHLWGRLEGVRRLIYHAAAVGDAGAPDALPAILSAKAEMDDCVVHVVNEAMTVTGGLAYQANGSMARHVRDARAAHVMSPTTDILRTWTGRALLGLPLLTD